MGQALRKPVEERIDDRLEFLDEAVLPAMVRAHRAESLQWLLMAARDSVDEVLREYGAILFRGFDDVSTAREFGAAARICFEGGLHAYTGGVSPRGEVSKGVFESTRFPAHLRIPQHNEMSYLPDPPRRLAFFCEQEPSEGGETPLADSRTIYRLMPEQTREQFESRGVAYHRYLYGPKWNLHDRTRDRMMKLYVSWMDAFSTEDPRVVEQMCSHNGSTVKWDNEEGAMISNVLPAVRRHPETGEMLWFNQVATFLSSPRTIGWMKWLLYRMAYWNPLRRPMHATYGDGQPIPLSELNRVNEAIDQATVRFKWRRGDFLLVDNFMVTHGRMPFCGERKILVAIGES
jgi:alpha-ketoglutarate-dependent taurine dioxygenase